ncbi:hypothetical protein [Corynebacterium sphenisci]|uniref:hypothetical protein n=1 Tax=Corynebacterium sphenisci TaxID=191493 RepID=UPI0026DFCDC1|nr:hypothetical protein [Corynebacterium sphenisci]MDO5730433.1 hypothetical protein [Corynebacterium sphenisci]
MSTPPAPEDPGAGAGIDVIGEAFAADAPATVAVLAGAGGEDLAVWHVELAPAAGGDRLSGAWLTGPGDGAAELARVLAGCAVLQVDAAVPDWAAPALAGVPRMDPAATAAELRAVVGRIRDRAAAERARPGRGNLTAPRLPELPDPAPVDVPHVGEPGAAAALGWARGLEALAEAWAEVDSQRRRRDWLRGPRGTDPVPLPLILH